MNVSYAASCVWVIESKLFYYNNSLTIHDVKNMCLCMIHICVRRKKYKLIVQIMILKLRLFLCEQE